MNERSRPVYSSEHGRLCAGCGMPVKECSCARKAPAAAGDGIVRLRRESKGRGGKTAVVITGVPLDEAGLKALAGELKRRCGTGGTMKDGAIEIQGEQIDLLTTELQKRGYKVKRSGG